VRPIVISGLVALAAGIGICAAALPAAKATSAAPAAASRPATTIPVAGALRAEHVIAGLRPGASPDFAASPAATLAANNELLDVSCIGANNCLAVGGNFAGGTVHGSPLAYHWDGAWHATPVKLPAGGTLGVLGSVSCKSDGCVAVGWYRNGTVNRPLAERWTGSNWAVMPQPPLASGGSADFLEWVSCASSVKNCVATGFYVPTSASNGEVALAEVWNGSSWKAYKPPTPSTSFSNLDAVSCTSTTNCLAVGGYLAGNGGLLLADLWNGSAWHQMAITQVTPQSGWFNFVNGVSCTATSCVAVGNTGQVQSNGTVKIAAFAEVHGASGWTKTSVPMPAGHESLLLTPSCVSATACVAVGGVGSYTSTNNQGHAAAATWSGSKWSVKVLTPPTGQGSLLMGVECVTATNCVATGTIGKSGTNTGHGLTAFWNGTTWKTVNTA
jgi:hypothetical protein